MRLVVAIVVALAAALALTGCGGDGDGGDDASVSYTNSVCQALNRYQDATGTAAADAVAAAAGSRAVEARRAAVDGVLGRLDGSLDDLIADLRAAGAPDFEGGQDLAAGALDAFGALPEVVDGVRAEIAALPDEGFEAQAGTVLAGLGSRFDFALTGLDVLSSDDFDAAAADASDCAGMF